MLIEVLDPAAIEVAARVAVTPEGMPDSESATVPPAPTALVVTVEVVDDPGATVAALAAIVKSAEVVVDTVSAIVAVCVFEPSVPVTVME